MNKRFIIVGIALLLVSCKKEPTKAQALFGNAFGTTYSIQYYPTKNFEAEKGIDSVLYAVNKSVSTYLPESDISKINSGDSTIVVDAIFKEVFRISEIVYTNSKGYFDPTIGVLRNAYGFGDASPLESMRPETIDSLMNYVGFRKVRLTKDGTIQKDNPNIYFDFNAVAKGYGIDCIGRYLEVQGVSNYIVELGGEILAKGTNKSKNRAWVVGVESPDSEIDNRITLVNIMLEDKGMASSGNYRKFRIDSITGKKYVHTLNPLTGSAEQSDLTSATVIANSCAEADAYATAFMALGLEKAKILLQQTEDVEAYLTFTDATNRPQVFISEGFQTHIIY